MSIINNNKIFVLFTIKENVFFSKNPFFEEELRNRRFNISNSHVLILNITYMRKNTNIVCLRPVLKN